MTVRGLLSAELTKLTSHPISVLGLVGMVSGVPALALILQLVAPVDDGDSLRSLTGALQLSQVFVIIVGASVFGAEYEASCLRTTYLAHPQRIGVTGAKLGLGMASMAVCGTVGAGLGAAVLALGPDGAVLPAAGVTAAAVAKCLLSWLGLGLLAFGLSVVTRSLIAPIAILVPLLLGLSQLVLSLTSYAALLPDLATFRAFTDTPAGELLGFWPGWGVQLLWAAAFVVPAFVLSQRRDVR